MNSPEPPQDPEKFRLMCQAAYDDVTTWCHCRKCLKELPKQVTPEEYASLTVGILPTGIAMIWCKRHKEPVAMFNIDDDMMSCGTPGCENCGGGFVKKPKPKPFQLKGKVPDDQPLFELGTVSKTSGVHKLVEADNGLIPFLESCMQRHQFGDGGDLSDEDKATNLGAILNGGRIVSSYNHPAFPEGKVWIITDEDREHTTVLLPSEY